MHEGGDDLAIAAFLKIEVDFDFVSTSLSNLGLIRGQLMEKEGDRVRQPEASLYVTHDVVVDLEKFRSKERLPDKFTVGWIRTLTGSTDSDIRDYDARRRPRATSKASCRMKSDTKSSSSRRVKICG